MRSEGILIVILILFKVFIVSLKHANADIWELAIILSHLNMLVTIVVIFQCMRVIK